MTKANNTVQQLRQTSDEAQARGGRAQRNAVTTRGNQTATQPEDAATAAIGTGGMLDAIADTPQLGKGNIFSLAQAELSKRMQNKMQYMGEASQQLAEAADLFKEGVGKSKEATEVAMKASLRLYQGRNEGIFTADEVNAILGDKFGYKPKSDGTPGKTPDGQGEAIRKRVVRCVQAAEHLRGVEGIAFFDGMTADSMDEDGNTLAEVVASLDEGNITVVQAYELFADIKKNMSEKVASAFNPKAIAAIVSALGQQGAADKVRDNSALVAAYAALIDALTVIGSGEDMAEAAE